MNRVERGLRRLALSDERTVQSVLAEPDPSRRELDPKGQALVRLGALLSIGAATVSLRYTVELAFAAGATEGEIFDVLLVIGPAVGHARMVAAAPRLALALGYDVDDAED